MTEYGPPGATPNGFDEILTPFPQGSCAMWIDATVAASSVTDPDNSTVADKVGFALAPDNERGNWLWAWSLGIPASSDAQDAAKTFVAWATSKDYIDLVAETEGWANVPPGTRTSLYEKPEYLEAAPFAQTTLESINAADPNAPTVDPVPRTGIQFVAAREFQGLGTAVGWEFAAALAGQKTAEEALASRTGDREPGDDGGGLHPVTRAR